MWLCAQLLSFTSDLILSFTLVRPLYHFIVSAVLVISHIWMLYDEIHKNMNLLKVSDIYECNILTFVNDIMMKKGPNSMQQYYQKRRNVYDVRVKNQLIVPQVRICVGERAVRVAGAALWNNMHEDMTQYRLRKCLKGRLRKHYIPKYHIWCIDWCLFLSVFDTYLPLLVLKIALFYSELSCHFVSYLPWYYVHFYLVVSKMSLVLPWQPPADNNVCFCLVKEYYLYICWKIKLPLLILLDKNIPPFPEFLPVSNTVYTSGDTRMLSQSHPSPLINEHKHPFGLKNLKF